MAIKLPDAYDFVGSFEYGLSHSDYVQSLGNDGLLDWYFKNFVSFRAPIVIKGDFKKYCDFSEFFDNHLAGLNEDIDSVRRFKNRQCFIKYPLIFLFEVFGYDVLFTYFRSFEYFIKNSPQKNDWNIYRNIKSDFCNLIRYFIFRTSKNTNPLSSIHKLYSSYKKAHGDFPNLKDVQKDISCSAVEISRDVMARLIMGYFNATGHALPLDEVPVLDFSSRCLTPLGVSLLCKVYDDDKTCFTYKPRYFLIVIPCRNCLVCKNNKANKWAWKARNEIEKASRTWMVTLTLTLSNQGRLLLNASALFEDFEEKDYNERFVCLCRALGIEVTKFLKRVRKNSNSSFRYMLSFEAHKSGRPHVHLFIHEKKNSNVVRKAITESCWKYGFSKVELVRDGTTSAKNTSWYICQYLTKANTGRV